MKELNYWQRFLNTGRVEDYLRFRENEGGETKPLEEAQKHNIMGEYPNAGIGKIDRDSVEDGAYRGIR